jgi:hypothetical protein
MRTAQLASRIPPAAAGPWRPRWFVRLGARLRAMSLDRDLALGVPAWQSPRHAARALQLTSTRRRWAFACSLDLLVDRAELQTSTGFSAAIPPCRPQVREALAEIVSLCSALRAAEPVDPRGVASLRRLLADGTGPCYTRTHPRALAEALQEVHRRLEVAS